MPEPPIAATIIARNYLPAARVLADSYLEHHAGAEFTVLAIDADTAELTEMAEWVPNVRFLGAGDLDLDADEFARMAMAYSVTELCTAVKPWLLQRLLAEYPRAIYLDPDIEVFAPFADTVGGLAEEHDIVLTPHVLEPMPRDGLRPSEADIMASGVFNLGFIGVSAGAGQFLRFWAQRLRTDAISAVTEQLFTDQRWVDNVPAMFRHTVVTDAGSNVAYWNVYQRPIERRPDGSYTAGGVPLRFYHYSGYRPEKPWLASTHYADRPRILLSEHPHLARLFADYRKKLLDAGYADALEDVPYRWSSLPDGSSVSASLRRAFRQAWVDAERKGGPPPPSPFGSGGIEPFLRWATEPANPQQRRAGLHRWAMSIWFSREDLRRAFPDPLGADADEFRRWCATSGVAEGEIHPQAVPTRPATRPLGLRDTLGVNVLGYLTAELGVGELGRLVHAAVRDSGVPLATAVEEQTVSNRIGHPLPDGARVRPPEYPLSVLCVNADMTRTTLQLHPDLGRDRYAIGVWSWELSKFPPAMQEAFSLVDEVWTTSDFARNAIAAHAPVPVHVFPVPIPDPLSAEPPARRRCDRRTEFLFIFDYNSVFERKNPVAAVTAFQLAFGSRDDVRLVIKSINGGRHPSDRERLRAALAGDDRIVLIEDYLDADEVRKLYVTADCYLSLHRSEGFGLTVAEAMAHGLPVIATDYSSTCEFLDQTTGWPIPYRVVPVGPGNPPYPSDLLWADPDLDAAVAALREVADDPTAAQRRGAAAREHILATRSPTAAAGWVRERLETAYQRWRRAVASDQRHLPVSVAKLRDAREALRWRADPTAPSRLPLAATLRRAVLRALDHYDHHQRTVLGALMDGAEAGIGELAARLDHLQATLVERLDRVEQRLAGAETALASQAEQTTDKHERLHAMLSELSEHAEGRHAQRSAELAQERLARGRQITELTQTMATVSQLADLDNTVNKQLAQHDRQLGHTETDMAQLNHALSVLRTALLRHHDLLATPPPEYSTTAVATDVGLLRLPAHDRVVLPWLRTYGSWEVEESRLIDALLPLGGGFLDIGAHIGYFTVRALHRVGPDGAVFAVEPWPPACELLKHNVAANVPAPLFERALTVLPVAAWDSDGPLRLAVSPDGNTGDNRIRSDGSLEVSGVRLDGVAAVVGRRIDVIKCDAQGRGTTRRPGRVAAGRRVVGRTDRHGQRSDRRLVAWAVAGIAGCRRADSAVTGSPALAPQRPGTPP